MRVSILLGFLLATLATAADAQRRVDDWRQGGDGTTAPGYEPLPADHPICVELNRKKEGVWCQRGGDAIDKAMAAGALEGINQPARECEKSVRLRECICLSGGGGC